jgi:hypothetical protein
MSSQACKNASRAKQAQLAAAAKEAEGAAMPMQHMGAMHGTLPEVQQLHAGMPLEPGTHNPMQFAGMMAAPDPGACCMKFATCCLLSTCV